MKLAIIILALIAIAGVAYAQSTATPRLAESVMCLGYIHSTGGGTFYTLFVRTA